MDETQQLLRLHQEIAELYGSLLIEDERHEALLNVTHVEQRDSARNLIHYAKLRDSDLQSLQAELNQHGLCSLGRSEARVLSDVCKVLRTLGRLTGRSSPERCDFDPSSCLEQHTADLFGAESNTRKTRIMVTAPSDTAENPKLMRALLEAGMDILRINCAHGTPNDWKEIATHVRYAEERTGRSCLILCDLRGPRLRTAPWGKKGKGKITLQRGDRFYLSTEGDETIQGLPSVPCATPSVLRDLEPGQPIWFDGGKLGGTISEVRKERALILVTHAPEEGAKLRGDKSINLPESQLSLPALSERDLLDLDTVTEIADLVGQSYIRDPGDVQALASELERRNASHLGVILNIETPTAFAQLPAVLLAGMRQARLGVMVARGDLAIELGFERLAEVQEEILWMCEAAHAPVIWATQVLETMIQVGQPSRAEVTDAAMSARAECVLLNEGPHVVSAVNFLSGVLTRMESHQEKQLQLLRRLTIADWLNDAPEEEKTIAPVE